MERKVDDEVDRLSELPEFVVQHILSFLPTKQVVQSTLFSKTWKHVWTTFPLLRFDKTFSSGSWYEVDRKKPDIQRKLVNFYNFVETTLRRHHRLKLRIKNFKLTDVLHKHKSMSRVDRWIRYVVESDVEELNLLIGFCGIHYCLPHSVLFAKSLTVLTLRMCKLVSMCDSGDINLPSLKKLSLSSVYGDDQIIQNLLAGCPVIECITFDSCRGITSIKIFGVPKVMVIRIQGNHGLERLELEASNNLYDLCINERLQVQPEQLDLLSFINLEVLSIRASCITNEWLHDHLLELPFLEDLQLLGMNWERLNISSHRLKSLDLFVCSNLVELNIDAPKLCRFQYLGVYIKCFSSNALALREALYTMIISDDPTDIKKIAFLSKLSNSKLLELEIDFAKVFLVLFLSFDYLDFIFFLFLFIYLYIFYVNSNMFFCLISL